MDLREYYRKIRQVEAGIRDEFVVIVSRATRDGGKAGVKTDVPRSLAAKLIVEEKAELASAEEAARFRRDAESRWKTASGLRKA